MQTQRINFSLHSLFLSSVAAIGGFLFGYDSAIINGTVEAITNAFHTGSVASGFAVASMLLGCALGAFFAGNLADKFGRKPVMFFTGILFFISALGSGIADTATTFVMFRLLGGLAVGGASVLAPTYISEIAPAKIRGRLASMQQLAIVVGIFSAFLVDYWMAHVAGSSAAPFLFDIPAWSWMFWSECIPSIFYTLLILLIPESPRYLVTIKQESKAVQVLARILPEQEISPTIDEIRNSLNKEHKPRFTDIFLNGRILPIVWIGIGLSVFQQFVGINVVFYYGSSLWQAAGFAENSALLINVLSGTVNIASTLVAIALIDKIGRKPLLLAGSIGMTVTLGVLTFLFTTTQSSGGQINMTSAQATLALVAAHLYILSFGASWGPAVWVLLGEMFNNSIRGAAMSVATSAQWMANFIIIMTFPILLANLGLFAAYGFYTFCALLSIIFVVKFVKETKGKKLEEI